MFPSLDALVPVWGRARQFAIVHQGTPFRLGRVQNWFFRLKLEWARRRVRLVTVSTYAQRELCQRLQIPASRIPVLPAGVSPAFQWIENARLPDRLPAGRQFLTHVGGFAPVENLPALVDVYAQLATEWPSTDLVFVGERRNLAHYDELRALERKIEDLGLASRVHFTGYLSDEELAQLLNHSKALVLPSWSESKGLSALEAAACGCPVVATRNSPLPEQLGTAGLYLDPARPEEWATLLREVATYPRRPLNGVDWEQSARQLQSLLEAG